jgi:cytochrome b subunit of formate dehydrogenase
MDILTMVIIVIVLVVLGVFGIGILFKLGKIAFSILLHMLTGWILLFVWNILPFFKIPIISFGSGFWRDFWSWCAYFRQSTGFLLTRDVFLEVMKILGISSKYHNINNKN